MAWAKSVWSFGYPSTSVKDMILVPRFFYFQKYMAQDKFFQEQFYYEYRTNALKFIDQKIVVQIIAAYRNTGLKLDDIIDMFPDAPVSKKLHHHLPYERTKEKCICGGF